MRFGLHISIAGGFAKACERAHRLACESMQLFAHNPRAWAYRALDEEEARAFRTARAGYALFPIAVHMPYLPNLASCQRTLYIKSIELLEENLRRAHLLGADYLVVHPGSCTDRDMSAGTGRVADALNSAFMHVHTGVTVLLENTAGQGNEIGSDFHQLHNILSAVQQTARVGICLDTAHAFAAGYDLSTPQGLEETIRQFDTALGRGRLHLLHLNDAAAPCGSRVDRHWHIGEGRIGRDGFRRLVKHSFFKNLAGIMETPQTSEEDDRRNMQTVRCLATGNPSLTEHAP